MSQIKAIVTDLDGTLLNSNKEVSSYTKSILNKVKEQGIDFCLATGRCPETVEYMLPRWGLHHYVRFILAMNGSVLYDLKYRNRQDDHMMKGDDLISVVRHFQDLPVIFQVLYGPSRYTSQITDQWIHRCQIFGESLIQVDMESFLQNRSTNKFILLFEPKLMPIIQKRAASFNHPSLRGIPSGKDCFEYTDYRVHKGYGLQKLSNYLHVQPENIAAFGDAGNDIEMLKMVNMSVAMKNGSDEVKSIARFQTEFTNNEDGVAKFIEQNILKADV